MAQKPSKEDYQAAQAVFREHEGAGNCQQEGVDLELWIDWPEKESDGSEEEQYVHVPSPARAALMCGDCPLLAACNIRARYERPYQGVMGGLVWSHGKNVQ